MIIIIIIRENDNYNNHEQSINSSNSINYNYKTMDLKQRKLNKAEWESIEVPVSQQEIDVLKLIIEGYNNVNVKYNNNNSIFTYLKIEYTPKMEDYVYTKYFSDQVKTIEQVVKSLYKDYKQYMKLNLCIEI